MDELVSQIAAKVGITDDQARAAVQMAVDFVKTKLPEPIASQLDGLVSGGDLSSAGGLLGQAEGLLGGFLGGNKQ